MNNKKENNMGKVTFNMTMSLDGFVAGPTTGPKTVWAMVAMRSSIGISKAIPKFTVGGNAKAKNFKAKR